MAITREVNNIKLSVTMKDDADKSLGTQSISNCNQSASLDNFLAAGQAVQVLMGATNVEIKKATNYDLISE